MEIPEVDKVFMEHWFFQQYTRLTNMRNCKNM